MSLTEFDQLKLAVTKANRVLVALPKDAGADAIGSGLALTKALKKMGKLVTLVSDEFVLPTTLGFLPSVDSIESRLRALQKFVITVNVDKDQIEEFSYDVNDGKLKMYITPKTGVLTPQDILSENSNYAYDLIVTVDCPDLESLGGLFSANAEFFHQTTIVNIDHKPGNEQFGQINITNPNACATAELTYQVLSELDKAQIDTDVATCLLTALIAKTRSFKTLNVTPAALEVASALLHAGADQTGIIKALYRSRTLATMNLWGRALARLRSFQSNTLVWSLITLDDFVTAGASAEDLPEVIDELIAFIPGVEAVALLYQDNNHVEVIIKALRKHNALYLGSFFQPQGTKELARFSLTDVTLLDAEKEVIGKIKEQIERGA